MDLIFNCPKCGQELEVDASGAGQDIGCPSCGSAIRIPEPQSQPDTDTDAESAEKPIGTWTATDPHPPAPVIAASAAAKVKMNLKVPVHNEPTEKLIAKPLVPLEVAARETDRQLRLKTFRHNDFVESGHDRFDEAVGEFLAKVGEPNVISVTPVGYSHIDIASQKLLSDYGLLVLYRG